MKERNRVDITIPAKPEVYKDDLTGIPYAVFTNITQARHINNQWNHKCAQER